MRRLVVLPLAMLLLAACTKPTAPVQPEATISEPKVTLTQPGQVYNPGGRPPAVAVAPIEADLPVPSPMPEGMRRVELAAGQSITEPGLYYMDVATGKLEGWIMPSFDSQRAMRWAQTTPDHRWITFGLAGQGYLIRRSDARAFMYNSERLRVTPGPGLFLLQPTAWRQGESRKFALVNEEMQLISTFTVDSGMPGNVQFLFSPDGKRMAVAEGSGGAGLSLVDVVTGTVTKLAGSRDDRVIRFVTLPALREFVVIRGDYAKPLWLERYNWEGKRVGRKQVEGWDVAISDDGRTLAVTQSIGHYGEVLFLQDWMADKPLLRVAGGLRPSWLASGAELVVETSRGWQLVSRTGDMRPVPQAGEARWRHFEWYLPSPDKPDMFLTGMKVIDRSGRVVQATQIAEGVQARALSAGWGPSSREVQIVVIPPLGKGYEMEPWANFLPRVQRPPFPERHPLQVQGSSGGECLNLRQEPTLKGRIARCLPAGTHLAVQLKPNEGISSHFEDQMLWLAVETEKGEKGWVAINTGRIIYAD